MISRLRHTLCHPVYPEAASFLSRVRPEARSESIPRPISNLQDHFQVRSGTANAMMRTRSSLPEGEYCETQQVNPGKRVRADHHWSGCRSYRRPRRRRSPAPLHGASLLCRSRQVKLVLLARLFVPLREVFSISRDSSLRRGLERATGIEPVTSSLGSCTPLDARGRSKCAHPHKYCSFR